MDSHSGRNSCPIDTKVEVIYNKYMQKIATPKSAPEPNNLSQFNNFMKDDARFMSKLSR